MNNEIKEILKKLKDREETYQFCKQYKLRINDWIYEAHHLLDYITNLQQEARINNDLIPYFKNKVKELKKEITNLQKENQRLKENNRDMQEEMVRRGMEDAKKKLQNSRAQDTTSDNKEA